MIISRSPLRISLGGGGTDLPSYYTRNEGFLISAAINKYVYVSVMKPFLKGIFLKYSEIEKVKKIQQIKHPILRETLKFLKCDPCLEITTLADIPAGTGLGSSGSFTTGLIKALYEFNKLSISKKKLAELACHVEINLLSEPIGKQDQYIASTGGINSFKFHKDHKVSIKPINLNKKNLQKIKDMLVLFFTGFSRKSSKILSDQKKRSESLEKEILKNLDFTKDLAFQSLKVIEKGDIYQLGEIMNLHWEHKRKRSLGMTNDEIDYLYNLGINNGAIGGKLVGAGGGGFLLFVTNDRQKLKYYMNKAGLQEVEFDFDFQGTTIMTK